MNSGPYLVLPLLGPSNFRDGSGEVVDGFLDPAGYYIREEYGLGGTVVRYTVDAIDWRAANLKTIDELRNSSLDFYATVRSAYRQRRAHEIRNGHQPDNNSAGAPGVIDFDTMDMDLELPPEEVPPDGQPKQP
jgi:phospholipid-binding lipoprotein MlaA